MPQEIAQSTSTASTVKEVIQKHQATLSNLDQLALWITNKIGTMGFFFAIFCWTILWLGWNTLGPAPLRFDPFPGFVLWLFISNMIQIFLMPLLLIGQNLQGAAAEKRTEYDYEVDQKAEQEIKMILEKLEGQNIILKEIQQKLGQ